MRLVSLVRIAFVCVFGFLAVAPFVPRAEGNEKAKEKESKGQGTEDQAAKANAEMAAWMAANRIGKEHEELQTNVGTWDVEGTFWMVPGAPPVKNQGVSKIRTLLGGRFIQEHYKADFMGQPFEGVGTTGYDTMKGIYISTWIDSMSNFIMHQEGLAGTAGGETITYYGGHAKPNGSGVVKTKMVYKVTGPDSRQLTAYELQGDGGERKTMFLVYTRREQ